MPFSALRLEPPTLFQALRQQALAHGVDLWVVGGYVRDALLGRPSLDVDLVVSADPADLGRALARELGGHYVVLDADFGVVRVVLSDGPVVDLARLQGERLADDLRRRDVTINAIALPLVAQGTVVVEPMPVDPTGGLEDLERRCCRAVSEDNLKADPVRLLRVIRVAAELDWAIDAETVAWLDHHRRALLDTAAERTSAELGKILAIPHAYRWIERLFGLGLLGVLLPELTLMARLPASDVGRLAGVAQALETVRLLEVLLGTLPERFGELGVPIRRVLASPIEGEWARLSLLKLASLLLLVGKPFCQTFRPDGSLSFHGFDEEGGRRIEAIARRLKLSGKARGWVEAIVRHQLGPFQLSEHAEDPVALFRFFRAAGDATVPILLAACATKLLEDGHDAVRFQAVVATILAAYFRPDRALTEPARLLDGQALMRELGLRPGKQIGVLLERVLEEQLRGHLHTREEAIAWTRRLLQSEGDRMGRVDG